MLGHGSASARDRLFDAAAVALAFALGLGMTWQRLAAGEPSGFAWSALLALLCTSLLLRRTAPLVLAWLTAAAAAATVAANLAIPDLATASADAVTLYPPTAPFAAYAALAYSGNRAASWTPVVLLAVLSAVALDPWQVEGAGARTLAFVVTAAVLGMYVAARRTVESALAGRAERAEREQQLLAAQARADERSRIAAEMHDVVTHRVSLMVLQAGALRVSCEDEQTREAAEELRSTGYRALEELRDLSGILPGGEDGAGPQRAQAAVDLPSLSAESGSVGVPVDLSEQGDPDGLSPIVARTAQRIVQEALTNARKHAPGTRVRVHADYSAQGVRLAVSNTAPTRSPDPVLVESGSGSGLSGLRWRVELMGGALEAGATSAGGFRIDARLPAYVPTPAAEEGRL
ncbi:sensor histidine kinase [Streptomonospora wellingtoniae]|uniref:histidine kinase n=1 Tax=Streptomonospora wellingtoniae TaxID=3075544 RepID=A0ABU2L0V2_9ACTN|nr:histidine kinase [Streptomonospora sp. DSM 45055]MDT0305184.1 histidine kinase [Streptomonospora sp. DSM 45055]